MPPLNIIFDLDGTLVDSIPGIRQSILFAIRAMGHQISDDLDMRALIGPPIKEGLASILERYGDDRASWAVTIYRAHYRDHGLCDTTLYPSVEEMLKTLKRMGATLYIATSKREYFAQQILKTLKIGHYFEAIHGSLDDGSLDDKSVLLSKIINDHKLERCVSLMIGDRENDIIAALYNRILPIGVLWGYGDTHELQTAGARYLSKSISTLPQLIASLPTLSANRNAFNRLSNNAGN